MKTKSFYFFVLLFAISFNLTHSQTYWTGNHNKRWNSWKNWNPQVVPDATTDVIIPGGLSTYPVLNNKELSVNSSVGTYNCRSLLVESGGLLTLSGNVEFLIYGDVSVEPDGKIYVEDIELFSGGNLYITGGSVENIKNTPGMGNFYFYNGSGGYMTSGSLHVFNSLYLESGTGWYADGGTLYLGGDKSIVTIIPEDSDFYVQDVIVLSEVEAEIDPLLTSGQQPFTVNGDFTVETEAFFTIPLQHQVNVAGNLYLKADMTGNKASFIDNNNLSISGETYVEKYYNDYRWHFISSPVSNAVSNMFLDIYLKSWSEEYATWTFIAPTDIPLVPGQGYEVWSTLGNPIVSYTGGNLNTGNFSPTLTATDSNIDGSIGDGEGWNFIGNPYLSCIDVGTENDPVPGYVWTNLDYTLFFWTGTQYAAYNRSGDGLGTLGADRYVTSMQSFFIKAIDFNPALTIPNSARLHDNIANFKSTSEDIALKLTVSGKTGGLDEVIIRNNNISSLGFDLKYDSYKLMGNEDIPQIFSITENNEKLSISTIPDMDPGGNLSIGFRTSKAGLYSISWEGIERFEQNVIYLEDLINGNIIELQKFDEYSFNHNPDNPDHRFNLLFKNLANTDTERVSSLNVYSSDRYIYIQTPDEESGQIKVYNFLGQELVSQNINSTKVNKIKVDIDGYYLVTVNTHNYSESMKVYVK